MVGPLVIIGGHEDKEGESVILREFLRLAGGKRARIVVLLAATGKPEEVGAEYTAVFTRLGAASAQALHIATRADACRPDMLELLEKANGLFFPGGDQARTTALLGGTDIDTLLRRRHAGGLVLAGTSAGASIMADTMILSGMNDSDPKAGTVSLGSGMGFMRDVLIDQHFAERGRVGRLVAAVNQHPRYLGIGIDENTAIIVQDGRFHTIGDGSAWMLDAADMKYTNFLEVADGAPLAVAGIQLSVAPPGYGFDLQERKLLQPNGKEAPDFDQVPSGSNGASK